MVPVLEVYDSSSGNDVLVGRARFSLRRGRITTTFAYDDGFIAGEFGFAPLEPRLPLASRVHHCDGIPGSFRDTSPDRWGRRLIDREARLEAESGGALPRSLDEVDYLVGVFDQTREGSLRFKQPDGPFLGQSQPIPPVIQLPELLHASNSMAQDEAGSDQVKELLEAGSASLGGARPKASVCDGEKLFLAKFSHPGDKWDVMAWEKTALDIAEKAGIDVPPSKLVRIGNQRVLLLERFDREESLLDGRRIGYMSAMTALGSSDGERRDYLELLEALPVFVRNPSLEARRFFRRIALSVAISNTDDHLRNLAFLKTANGWALSPAFDINPNPYEGAERATAIFGGARANEAEALKGLADCTGMGAEVAAKEVSAVLSGLAGWEALARRNGCPDKEIALFAPIFKRKAQELRKVFKP